MTDTTHGWGRTEAGGFRVWAPGQPRMVLARPGHPDLPLTPAAGGWHEAGDGTLPPGMGYGLSLGGETVPDPASRAQPGGPADPSRAVDDAFDWTDAAWTGRPWHETVLYELHIGTFTPEGTFRSAIDRLDHLGRLGVTVIELMPVGTFAGARNWGYDGVLPFAPFHGYGGPDDLRRLVDAAHARGIAVILDVVYNHFGPADHAIPRYAPEFFTDAHATPWGEAIDFARPAVRAFVIGNALYWLDSFHLDGLRLDAVQAIFDDGPVHILDELAERARAAFPERHVHLLLENDRNEARWLARDGGRAPHYDAQWNDDFHHVMRVLLAGSTDGYYRDYATRPLERLGRALAEGFSYQGGEESIHRPGLLRGTPSAHLPPAAFVNFLQNHDQVGNTPFGRRLAALASPAALRLGLAITLLGPAVPMLFMGEEWAATQPFHFFCDYRGKLADAVRAGRRAEFEHLPEFADPARLDTLPDPNAPATFCDSVLDWSAPTRAPHAGWLDFTRELLRVRRAAIVPLLPLIEGDAGRFVVSGTVLEVGWRLRDGRALVLVANVADARAPWPPPDASPIHTLGRDDDGLDAWGLRIVLHPASSQ